MAVGQWLISYEGHDIFWGGQLVHGPLGKKNLFAIEKNRNIWLGPLGVSTSGQLKFGSPYEILNMPLYGGQDKKSMCPECVNLWDWSMKAENMHSLERAECKMEFIWLGSTRRLARCTFDPIIIGGVPIQPSFKVRDLGAYIDSGMSYTDHVTRLTRTCFFHIRQLRSIRRSLTVDSSHALVRALILTRLEYCNGLLGGAPKCLLSPFVSRPAGCCSFDSAASSHQQCQKLDSHRAALAGCSCEGDFQAVLARSSVSLGVIHLRRPQKNC